ncbi:MAG: phage terminase large subunit family protein [Spirochaetes bacterium]|nr:phage terminase large subunit family protein [Spirochaetota bacterium]
MITQTTVSDIDYLTTSFLNITDTKEFLKPSEYNEQVRYLPPGLTPFPGYYDYNRTPYLREIVDRFSPLDPCHEIDVMKSAQIGATVGILESGIAYFIGCAPRPILYVSADKGLIETGMELRVERMLDSCGLRDLIFSQSNIKKTRNTGDTKNKKEYPGGFLLAVGARNPGKLRMISVPVAMIDELDGCPEKLGDEGNVDGLITNRTNAFASIRKILRLSTPLIMQTSQIYKNYMAGDRRHFHVPCKCCGEYIVLDWHYAEAQTKTGDPAGIVFDVTESGMLIPSTVRYKCQMCGGVMENHDKALILTEGLWKPTAESTKPSKHSYWINSCYSPPGMYSWEDMCYDWLKAWDPIRNRVKDFEEFKTFYQTKRGWPIEERGESPKFERIIANRRMYSKNTVPNHLAIVETGSPVLVVVASCDVHADNIMIDINGYCIGGRSYQIDFRVIEGDTESLISQCYRELERIIENETWISDDGKIYKIRCTFIDAGYRTDQIYQFCSQYSSGVYPTFGRDYIAGGLTLRELNKKTIEKAGCMCYDINVTKMKDRIAAAIRRDWTTGELQPEWRMNFPEDMRDDYFNQYTTENKYEKRDKITNRFLGFEWRHKPGADNHAFDARGYNFAGLEFIAEYACIEMLKLDSLNWEAFWQYAKDGNYYQEVTRP